MAPGCESARPRPGGGGGRAARLDHHNALVLYTDELAHFDLPTDPDGPDEQLESLPDQLAFVQRISAPDHRQNRAGPSTRYPTPHHLPTVSS